MITVAWIAGDAVLVLWTLAVLVSAIEEAGSHATYASRAPGLLIVLAVLCLLAGAGALYSAVRVARGRAGSPGKRARSALTVLTVALILFDGLVGLVTGPL